MKTKPKTKEMEFVQKSGRVTRTATTKRSGTKATEPPQVPIIEEVKVSALSIVERAKMTEQELIAFQSAMKRFITNSEKALKHMSNNDKMAELKLEMLKDMMPKGETVAINEEYAELKAMSEKFTKEIAEELIAVRKVSEILSETLK